MKRFCTVFCFTLSRFLFLFLVTFAKSFEGILVRNSKVYSYAIWRYTRRVAQSSWLSPYSSIWAASQCLILICSIHSIVSIYLDQIHQIFCNNSCNWLLRPDALTCIRWLLIWKWYYKIILLRCHMHAWNKTFAYRFLYHLPEDLIYVICCHMQTTSATVYHQHFQRTLLSLIKFHPNTL